MIVADDINVAEWTDQQVFDHVVRHLGEQRRRSYFAAEDLCSYRHVIQPREEDNNGDSPICLACDVGCLISDGKYFDGLEGNAISIFYARFQDQGLRDLFVVDEQVYLVMQTLGFDPQTVEGATSPRARLLAALQNVHDEALGPSRRFRPKHVKTEHDIVRRWPIALTEVAAFFGLDASVIAATFIDGWKPAGSSEDL